VKTVKTILSQRPEVNEIVRQWTTGRKFKVEHTQWSKRAVRILFFEEFVPDMVKVEERVECTGIKEVRTGKIYNSVNDIPHRLKFELKEKGNKPAIECIYKTIKKEFKIPATIVGKAFAEYDLAFQCIPAKMLNKRVKLVRYEQDDYRNGLVVKFVVSR